jgi:hypothetical protein
MRRFDIIIGVAADTATKELPTRQAPCEEGNKAGYFYRNNEEIQLRTSSNVSSIRTRTDSLRKFFKHYLLSMKPGVNPQRLTPGFVFVSKNMPPRKEVPPVYMEVA